MQQETIFFKIFMSLIKALKIKAFLITVMKAKTSLQPGVDEYQGEDGSFATCYFCIF